MKVLFTAAAIRSHVTPLLPLARAFRKTGHDVLFATGPELRGLVERAGLGWAELGPDWKPIVQEFEAEVVRSGRSYESSDERVVHISSEVFIRMGGDAAADDVTRIAQQWGPDLIVSTLTEIGGPTAAEVLGIPYAIHGYGPPKAARVAAALLPPISRFKQARGVHHQLADMHFARPYIDPWPTALAVAPDRAFTNPIAMQPEYATEQAARAAQLSQLDPSRTVYVTMGSMFNQVPGAIDRLIDAAAQLDVEAVVTLGEGVAPGSRAPRGERIHLYDFIPQAAVLPWVGAMLSHAGAGGTLGAAANGVPHVMVPFHADQYEIAEGAVAAGIGLAAAAEPTAIADALATVLADSEFKRRAALVAAEMSMMPTADEVVDRVWQAAEQFHLAMN